jgi:hypothetical protein
MTGTAFNAVLSEFAGPIETCIGLGLAIEHVLQAPANANGERELQVNGKPLFAFVNARALLVSSRAYARFKDITHRPWNRAMGRKGLGDVNYARTLVVDVNEATIQVTVGERGSYEGDKAEHRRVANTCLARTLAAYSDAGGRSTVPLDFSIVDASGYTPLGIFTLATNVSTDRFGQDVSGGSLFALAASVKAKLSPLLRVGDDKKKYMHICDWYLGGVLSFGYVHAPGSKPGGRRCVGNSSFRDRAAGTELRQKNCTWFGNLLRRTVDVTTLDTRELSVAVVLGDASIRKSYFSIWSLPEIEEGCFSEAAECDDCTWTRGGSYGKLMSFAGISLLATASFPMLRALPALLDQHKLVCDPSVLNPVIGNYAWLCQPSCDDFRMNEEKTYAAAIDTIFGLAKHAKSSLDINHVDELSLPTSFYLPRLASCWGIYFDASAV